MVINEKFVYVVYLLGGKMIRGLPYDTYDAAYEAAKTNVERRTKNGDKVTHFLVERWYVPVANK